MYFMTHKFNPIIYLSVEGRGKGRQSAGAIVSLKLSLLKVISDWVPSVSIVNQCPAGISISLPTLSWIASASCPFSETVNTEVSPLVKRRRKATSEDRHDKYSSRSRMIVFIFS